MELRSIIYSFMTQPRGLFNKEFWDGLSSILIKFFVLVLFGSIVLFILGMAIIISRDKEADYEKKNIKIKVGRDQLDGRKYYAIDFWNCQKNKRKYIEQTYNVGTKLFDKTTVIETGIYERSLLKKEYRFYSQYIGDQVRIEGDIIGRDKITNSGIQINNIQNQIPDDITEAIRSIAKNDKITRNDRDEIMKILNMIQDGQYSEQKNQTMIDILSKYANVISSVAGIIGTLKEWFVK